MQQGVVNTEHTRWVVQQMTWMNEGDYEEFSDTLLELKSRGAMLLVLADSGESAVHKVSSRLLGDRDSRFPVFILIDRDTALVEARMGDQDQLGESQIIDWADDFTRLTMTRSSRDESGDATQDEVLTVFEGIVSTQLEALTGAHDFGPSDLRICLESFRPLLKSYSPSTVGSFLAVLRHATRSHQGMTHVVYPGQFKGGLPDAVTTSFDVVIWVRGEGRDAQQRWQLVQSDHTTEWFSLDPP